MGMNWHVRWAFAFVCQTIIHVHEVTKSGYELSGYIDFRDRLRKEEWSQYFSGKKRLSPTKADLSLYHWRTEQTHSTNSPFYKVRHLVCLQQTLSTCVERLSRESQREQNKLTLVSGSVPGYKGKTGLHRCIFPDAQKVVSWCDEMFF